MSLEDGQLQLQYKQKMFKYHHVRLSSWFSLILSTYHGDVMLKVDDSQALTISLDISKGGSVLGDFLCFGDCLDKRKLGGFTGCMADMLIGHKHVALLSEEYSSNGQKQLNKKDIEPCKK